MPDRPESTSRPARPAVFDPERLDLPQGCRETMLLHITDKPLNRALRVLTDSIYILALDYGRYWPELPGRSTVWEMRAALGDLRHLENFLQQVAASGENGSPADVDIDLAMLAGREHAVLHEMGDRIERLLAGRHP